MWSEPFSASASDAVSVEWKAAGNADDYEIYGFLVEVDDSAGCSASTDFGGSTQAEKEASHSLLVYSRGKQSKNYAQQAIFNTAKGEVSVDGCYRFRLVNGTYDASGGFAVGSEFTVQNLRLGRSQVITAPALPDLVKDTVNSRTVSIGASSNASNATLTYTLISSQNSVCSVNSSGVITVAANTTGYCSVAINSAAVDAYSAAPTTYTSFTVLAAATAPVYSGGAAISGQATICSTLTVSEGSWADGGSAVTATSYQWFRDGVAISGATSSTYSVQDADLGKAINFEVTKVNSVGDTSAPSSAVVIVDARLTALNVDSTTGLSPSFSGCQASYTTQTTQESVTVTATMNSSATSIAVSGSAVVSGQTSSPITLLPGSNVISVVVTSGTYTQTTNITVTYAAPPEVHALAPAFTDGTQATLSATIDANGFNTSAIAFTITPTGGTSGTPVQGTLSPSQVTGNSSTTVEQDVTGLVSGGTYLFEVSATNANGTSTASYSFQTPDAPSVVTGLASNVAATSASVSYEINTYNRSTAVTLSYSVNPDMSSATEITVGDLTAALSSTTGDVDITGLNTGTTYYYTFSALNGAGQNTGAIRSFTTFGAPVVAVVAGVAGERTALLKATVNAAGLTTSLVRFYYSTATNFASSTSITATPSVIAGSSDTNVQAQVTNLNSGTYYYKVEAVNSAGSTLSSGYETLVVTDSVPTVTLSAPATVATGGSITVTVRFSETVLGFISGDLGVSGVSGYTAGAAQDLGGGAYSVNLTTTGTSTGSMTIALNANVVTEATGAGRGNAAATSVVVVVGATPPAISYTSNSLTLTVGQAMTALTPVNSGGTSTSWSPSVALPSGVTLNASTGVISGTPTAVQSATSYVITAENDGGTDTYTITITVVYQIPGVSFQSAEYTLVIGNPFNETPANSGGPISSWTIVGSLPAGLVFDPASGAISGTPSAISELVSITISGQNGTGTSSVTVGIRVLAVVNWNGPHVELISPSLIITSGGETVTLSGLRLNRIESVQIDGISLEVTVISNKRVTFVTPSLSPGVKNLSLKGTRVGKHEVVSALVVVQAPEISNPLTESPSLPDSPATESQTVSPEIPSPVTESPTVSPEAPGGSGGSDSDIGETQKFSLERVTLSGFNPGSAVLTRSMVERLAATVSSFEGVVAFSCIGFTQGPTVLDVDEELALARANAVCAEMMSLFPEAEVRTVAGRQDQPVGAPVRRVEIYLVLAL